MVLRSRLSWYFGLTHFDAPSQVSLRIGRPLTMTLLLPTLVNLFERIETTAIAAGLRNLTRGTLCLLVLETSC